MQTMKIKTANQLRREWNQAIISQNMDAASPGLFLRSLEQYVPGIVQQDTPPADIESIVFHSASLEFGPTKVTSTFEEVVGEATEGFTTDDVTISDVREFEEGSIITPLRHKYSYSQDEIEAAIYSAKMRQNSPSSASKIERYATAAMKSLVEKKHLRGMFGNAATGAPGLLNNPNVPVIASGSGDSEDVLNPATTNNSIYKWFIKLVMDIKKLNKQSMLYPTDTCLISLDLAARIIDVDTTSGSDTDLYTLIENGLRRLGITRILQRQEVGKDFLETYGVKAPGTNEEMVMFFSSAPESTYRLTTPVDMTPAYFDGVNYSQTIRCNVAPVQINYPGKALYAYYPNTL